MNENKVPQDIIDAATHYADNHDHIHQEYKAYVQGRIDERAAHKTIKTPRQVEDTELFDKILSETPQPIKDSVDKSLMENTVVSDVDVENLAKAYAERVGKNMTGVMQNMLAEVYTEGYNAAIQSQSVQPKEDVTEYYVSDRIELLAGKWRIESGIVTATEDAQTNADNIFAAGYMYAQEEMQQSIGSVREIADKEIEDAAEENLKGYDESMQFWITKSLKRAFKEGVKWVYDSAARNLPVGNGWADSAIIDTFQAAREFNSQDGVVDIDVVISFTGADNSDLSPVYANAEEFLQQYKLTHSPSGNTTEK